MRIDAICHDAAAPFHPPDAVVRGDELTFFVEVNPGQRHRRNRQQDEQACGETNLRFPIHGRIDVLVRKSLLALKHVPCQRRYGIGRIKSHVRKRLDLIIELAEALIYAFWKESTGFGKLLFKRNLGFEIAPLTFKKRGELTLPSTKATEAISE